MKSMIVLIEYTKNTSYIFLVSRCSSSLNVLKKAAILCNFIANIFHFELPGKYESVSKMTRTDFAERVSSKSSNEISLLV